MSYQRYIEKLRTASITEVSFGYQTIKLYTEREIENAQIGYSINQSGDSLINNSPGSWKPNWLVIGFEEINGDPIFIDIENDLFPVYTAMHGEEWDASIISSSFNKFISALSIIKKYSQNRTNPVKLENNPISKDDIQKALSEIDDTVETDFWELIFEEY